MSKIIRIVAAIVDTQQLTLYKEDGSTIEIPQGDVRLRKIIDEATPQLISQGWADVTIEFPKDNSYADFEDKSNGVVKFFRVAKAKLKKLFTPEPVEPLILGQVPEVDESEQIGMPSQPTILPEGVTSAMKVIDEIMAHATPVKAESFSEKGLAKQGKVVEDNGITCNQRNTPETEDTMIAVVNGKIIPGVELIKSQFDRAAKLGSTIGVENFLKRIAAVIDKRSHSIEDLLKFMERGDLPIADDGTILIYKLLNRVGNDEYVDVHSGKVVQFVGAYVCMDEKLVDRNRNNECSNGLHVARRGYLRSFSGNVCVLAKLAPEDVIAVPTYDANKMRVCGYHIIAELTNHQRIRAIENKPITDQEAGRVLLAKALSGDHVRRTHEVRITEQNGGGLQTKKFGKAEAPATVPTPAAPKEVVALENASSETGDRPVVPLDVVKSTEAAVLSRKDQAQALYKAYKAGDTASLEKLRTFKKTAKVGWDKLGITDTYVMSGLPESPKTPVMPKVSKPKAHSKQAKKVKAKAKKVNNTTVTNKEFLKVAKAVQEKPMQALPAKESSHRDRIQKMLSLGRTTAAVATQILTIKKNAKKSWQVLGVSDADVAVILKLTEV